MMTKKEIKSLERIKSKLIDGAFTKKWKTGNLEDWSSYAKFMRDSIITSIERINELIEDSEIEEKNEEEFLNKNTN